MADKEDEINMKDFLDDDEEKESKYDKEAETEW
jgi:hypothetical protein